MDTTPAVVQLYCRLKIDLAKLVEVLSLIQLP